MAIIFFVVLSIFYSSLLFHIAIAMPGAMPWLGPAPTPMSLMATAGMSPQPTEPPGLNGIPRELRRRQNQYQYPPPPNWCGFVDSLYDDPLSCSVGLTCVNSGTALGCCTATTGLCTALYTTCANYGDVCDEECQVNPAIKKCDDLEPYCGTFSFPGDTYLFNCMVTSALIQDVEFLNDFYVTAIGSTLASEPTTNPFGFTASASLAAYSSTPGVATTFPTTSSAAAPTATNIVVPLPGTRGGLSIVAFDGIIAAGAVVCVLIFATTVFCCIRARRKRNIEAAKPPPAYSQSPPMQQQAQQLQSPKPEQPPFKAFGSYQSVPQQDQRPEVVELHNSVPPTPELPPSPPPQSQPSFLSPSSSFVSAPTHQSPPSPDPRLSSGATTLLSPMSPNFDPRQSYYKPPISPAISEKDAAMSNPSVPVEAAHSVPTEVDATTGNPGVPVDTAEPGVPVEVDATPYAAELDGISNWAGGGAMSQGTGGPQQPVEMGHHWRE